MKIDIREIKINKEIYPRFSANTETILNYRMNVEKLPAIDIAKEDNTLLDGYHRYMAHRDEGISEIECNIVDIPEHEYFLYSIKKNASHGLQLTRDEKKKACLRLYEDWLLDFTVDTPSNEQLLEKKKETALLLAVSEEKIRQWVKDTTDKINDEKKKAAWDLWTSCHTEDEIAESIKVPRKTINDWVLAKKQELGKSPIFPESLQFYNIWNIGTRAKIDTKYPGRLPLDVMENILYYYTDPFDIVLDPMAGGGTTINACKNMARRYLCYDLVGNVMNDINPHNILKEMPKKKNFPPNLIFLDPPYWKQMDKYSGHKENLMNMTLEKYLDAMNKIIKECYQLLKESGILAIIVSPTQTRKIIYDIQHDFYKSCEQNKFTFLNRIIVPYSTEQVTGAQVKQAKDGKYMLKLYRDLLIFKK